MSTRREGTQALFYLPQHTANTVLGDGAGIVVLMETGVGYQEKAEPLLALRYIRILYLLADSYPFTPLHYPFYPKKILAGVLRKHPSGSGLHEGNNSERDTKLHLNPSALSLVGQGVAGGGDEFIYLKEQPVKIYCSPSWGTEMGVYAVPKTTATGAARTPRRPYPQDPKTQYLSKAET